MWLKLEYQSAKIYLKQENVDLKDEIGELAAQVVTLNELVGKFELN